MAVTQPTVEPQVVTLKANANWDGGVRTSIKVRDFAPIITDEPAQIGGEDKAPNPMEYILSGYLGCFTVMLKVVADELNISFQDLKLNGEGDIDLRGALGRAPVRPYFKEVRTIVEMSNVVGPKEQLTALQQRVTERCPAYNLFKGAGVEPKVDWHITPVS